LEEIRRQARENWLQSRQQMVGGAKKRGPATPKMLTKAPGKIKVIQSTTILMSSAVPSKSYGDPVPAVRGALVFKVIIPFLKGFKKLVRTF
jgi:hypothetical protein